FWSYQITLDPNETAIILNFVTGQPSLAAARAQADAIVPLPPNTLQCVSPTELTEIVNFAISADLSLTKTGDPNSAIAGGTDLTYTLTADNLGPATVPDLQISDPLPAGTTFVSASPSAGGNCVTPAVGANGTVTCTWNTDTPPGTAVPPAPTP